MTMTGSLREGDISSVHFCIRKETLASGSRRLTQPCLDLSTREKRLKATR